MKNSLFHFFFGPYKHFIQLSSGLKTLNQLINVKFYSFLYNMPSEVLCRYRNMESMFLCVGNGLSTGRIRIIPLSHIQW